MFDMLPIVLRAMTSIEELKVWTPALKGEEFSTFPYWLPYSLSQSEFARFL